MAEQFTNRAESVLASGIAIGATSLTVTASHGARFPSTGDFSILLQDAADATVYELVKATARSTDTLTITATANAWDAGDKVVHVVDKRVMDALVQLTGDQTVAGIKTFSSIPVGPASDPTTDNQLARKAYVDTKQALSGKGVASGYAGLGTDAKVADGQGRVQDLLDWQFARKTADESVTSSITLQDDDHLTFAIAANEVWQAEFILAVDGAAAGDLRVSLGVPAGATYRRFDLGPAPGVADAETSSVAIGSRTTGVASFGTASATDTGTVRVVFLVVNGATAGTIVLQWAQLTSSATATTLRQHSHMMARRVA